MGDITRRLFLRSVPPSLVLAGSSIAAPIAADAAEPMTAEERYRYHLDEFKRAAEELDPRIGSWNAAKAADDDLNCAIAITAFRVTGRYAGDGLYEGGSQNWNGTRTKYSVRLLDYRTNGKRMFEVCTLSQSDRMVLAEPRLNTFIGKKMSGGAS